MTRRWQVEVEPCPAVAEGLPIGGTIVLTQDSWGVADALASRLSARRAYRLLRSDLNSEQNQLLNRKNCLDTPTEQTPVAKSKSRNLL